MATKKTYTHAVFSIADPLVKNLIEQAIYACKFRLKFPGFYRFMVNKRSNIKEQLRTELIKAYTLYDPELSAEKLDENIEVILEERRFLDNAIGFVQTGKVLLPDFFLVSNGIMSVDKINLVFSHISENFWNEIVEELYSDEGDSGKEKVLSYLNQNKFYLPNLFPRLDIEDLFISFLPIHLSYKKFKSSNDPKGHSKLPTTNECYEILKPLFRHPSPLYFNSVSCMDYNTEVNEKLTLTHFALQIGLDEPLENLPYLLRDFLISYQSRRLDFMKMGNSNKYNQAQIDEINNLSAIGNEVLSVLDKFSNQRIGNRKDIHSLGYDAVLNSILALTFIHFHCERIFNSSNLAAIDLGKIDQLIMSNSTLALKDNQQLDELLNPSTTAFKTNYGLFTENLVQILKSSDQLHVSVCPPNRGKKKIQSIQIMLQEKASNETNSSKKEKLEPFNLNVNSLKKAVSEFLKKRIPDVDIFIRF
ncbi:MULTISPECIES: hypothetical protein [Acinetobacter]|uniref:hypothetical protein n=1 Tax=Acinetobacter TaxID=469 RepID=UPI000C555205|nr:MULTISPECIES: hypothetical protein [unclassified Acinetobacter]MBC68569.1 hypothetical protein [Acinetobacter sp.]MBT50743.1 hypothetical protein [Acinetobacter sp.]